MNRSISKKLFIFLCLFLFGGCASSTLDSAIKKGATGLDNEEIYSLVNDNTLRLVASDFDSYIFFSPDGSLAALSIFNNNIDHGSWDIKSDQRLCIKFNVWYYGDVKCYSIYQEGGGSDYLLFTNNGSLAYTGNISGGNSQRLPLKTQKDKKEVFVRSSMSKGQSPESSRATPKPAPPPVIAPSGPGANHEEITQTVKDLAKNCPGCNFEDADLRNADLIGANLKDANLSGANLSRANLRRANLEGANLKGATLLSTNLPGANLKDADFTGADLTGSNLIHADFTGADLDNIILKNTLQEGTKGLK
ncbi:MAG: pentapeptide repeat-containing protein [Desulfocapsa sp.]|nr:pentapeptide repeat-containing protein [Desulfocapsa sp.]